MKLAHPHLAGLIVALLGNAASAQFALFQNGADEYSGTVDTVFSTGRFDTPLSQAGVDEFGLSLDELPVISGNAAGEVDQGAIRFDGIFGPGAIPLGAPIVFAELRLTQFDSAAEGAVTFNRVLGADPDRLGGAGVWGELDTWSSLGGEPDADPFPGNDADENAISVGTLDVVAADNEAIAAPESFSDAGAPRGVLPAAASAFDIGPVAIDVTDSVAAWSAGEINAGWVIQNTTANGWGYINSDFGESNPAIAQALVDQFVGAIPFAALRPQLLVVFASDALADIDGSGVVDTADYDILRHNLGAELDGPLTLGAPGDLDFDLDVDLDDFNLFLDFFPGGPVGLARALAAPEPSAGVLVGLVGALAMTCRRAHGVVGG